MPHANRAYVISGSVAFYPHPQLKTMWLRVHPCILVVDCNCGAKRFQRCRNYNDGHAVNYTHGDRRKAAGVFTTLFPCVIMLGKDWQK